ncbi:hypothetical protein IMZ08_19400 [Bacillus luteolus]|uniref:Uncharacterized protein n=1 Tax=Litchfieldia luteola TaxID=682179 RepID=A0ABR9QNY7_9BACI|nr:hypothetical protein [Cytobacillus luteolus]MBE4910208.1 hypothetical protein [Cytobacillus luteolus]MBP1942222.1 hypothetical protein [Cytobacillus luteolus]
MYFVVVDIGCSDCGESSNLVGIFTTEENARNAMHNYMKDNHLTMDGDHELLIFKLEELNRVHNNSYDHLIFSSQDS